MSITVLYLLLSCCDWFGGFAQILVTGRWRSVYLGISLSWSWLAVDCLVYTHWHTVGPPEIWFKQDGWIIWYIGLRWRHHSQHFQHAEAYERILLHSLGIEYEHFLAKILWKYKEEEEEQDTNMSWSEKQNPWHRVDLRESAQWHIRIGMTAYSWSRKRGK